jgi:hypothetical protein
MRDYQRRGWSYAPVSCCLSVAGIRFSSHPFPAGDWAFLAVGLPDNARTPSGFHVSHVRVATGEGALSTPRTAVLTRPTASLRPPPAASQRQCPYTPAEHPSSGAQLDEASLRVHCIHPSGLPLACGPRMERAPLGFPRSFAPRRYQRRTSGWGQALSTGLGLRSRRHGSTLLPTSPLVSCDLVSHVAPVAAPGTALLAGVAERTYGPTRPAAPMRS